MLPTQYAKVLYELTKDTKGKELERAVQIFIAFLREEQVLSKASYIMDAFERYAKEQQGVVQLKVTSARPLPKKQLDAIKKTFGKSTEVETEIDESLIGGVVVRTANRILDVSMKTQLQKMKSSLV